MLAPRNAASRLAVVLLATASLTVQSHAAATATFKPFRLQTPDGVTLSLSDVMGKATLVVFFFPTCRYCDSAVSAVQKLHTTYKDRGLSVVWINVVPEQDHLVAKWRHRHGDIGTILLGGEDVHKQYAVTMTPTQYVLDRDGKILARQIGFKRGDETRLEHTIQTALAPGSPSWR